VVGAGLAGLAASIGLAEKLGCSVALVERRADWERRGSAFGLAPNGIKALREVVGPDVVQQLEERGIYMPASGGYFFGWWMVRDALLRRVRQLPPGKVTVTMGYSLTSFDDESDPTCVTARFVKTKDEGGEGAAGNDRVGDDDDTTINIKAKLLIGADGCYSTIRELLGLKRATRTGKTQWRGSVIVPPPGSGSPLEPLLEHGVAPLNSCPDLPDEVRAMTCGSAIVGLFNLHPKTPRRMPFTLVTDVPDVPEAAHASVVFDKVLHHP